MVSYTRTRSSLVFVRFLFVPFFKIKIRFVLYTSRYYIYFSGEHPTYGADGAFGCFLLLLHYFFSVYMFMLLEKTLINKRLSVVKIVVLKFTIVM